MVQSMTGFGAAEADEYRVEVRSLNHRFLDINIKMPSALLEHEGSVRSLLKERLGRGKIDVHVSFTDKARPSIRVDQDLARAVYAAFADLRRDMGIKGQLDVSFLAGFKEILVSGQQEYPTDSLMDALRKAVGQVQQMRTLEGRLLADDLLQRLNSIDAATTRIEEFTSEFPRICRDTVAKRVTELLGTPPVDEARIAQEIAILAQRSDVSEEIARLKSHLHQFRTVLSEDGIVGKRLDFVIQEMNREVNTIASKVDDIRVRDLSIAVKTEIERLREQVQNLQ